jgi:hypothetical protein
VLHSGSEVSLCQSKEESRVLGFRHIGDLKITERGTVLSPVHEVFGQVNCGELVVEIEAYRFSKFLDSVRGFARPMMPPSSITSAPNGPGGTASPAGHRISRTSHHSNRYLGVIPGRG